MAYDLFQGYEVKEMDGELTVILDINTAKQEFSSELGLKTKTKNVSLEQEAERYIRSIFPKLKIARVFIMADSFLLTSFPLQKRSSSKRRDFK
jgi:hypothetical protein